MTTDLNSRRPNLFRRTIILAAAAGLAVAVGCDRDEGSRSVREASTGLHTVTGGATTVTPAGVREKTYAGVINSAKAGTDGSTSANAANVVTAQAQLGQATEPMAKFAAAEREGANRTTVIRSLLAAYVQHSSQAAAARQYDPSKDLAEIDKNVAAKVQEIAEQEKIRADIDSQVSGLRAQAKQELDAAAGLDAEAAKFREEASKVSAVQGEGLIRQSAERRRAADAHRMKGLQFQAQVDVTEPLGREAAMLVEKLTNQKSDFEATSKELHERDAAAKALAASASAEASKSAEKLSSELSELAKLRSGAMASAAEDAQSKLNAAKGTAQKAASAGGAAKLLLGDINQTLAELSWQRSFGHGAYGQLLEAIAATQPALSDKSKYEGDAKTAREEEKKALEAAKEAFDAAKSAYQGAGAKGEAKDRLDRLGELLEKSGQRAAGEKLDLLGAFAVKATKAEEPSDAEPAPAAAGGDAEAELRTVLESMLGALAQDQYDQYFSYAEATTPEQQQIMGMMRGLTRLDAACKAKFSESFIAKMTQMGAAMGGGAGADGVAQFEKMKSLKVEDLTIAIDGDKAVVTPPDSQPMNFIRKDGEWKLDLSMPPELAQNPQMQQGVKMMGLMGSVFDELAGEVDAGQYASIDAVMAGMGQKMTTKPEFLELMRQMQGGGGGG